MCRCIFAVALVLLAQEAVGDNSFPISAILGLTTESSKDGPQPLKAEKSVGLLMEQDGWVQPDAISKRALEWACSPFHALRSTVEDYVDIPIGQATRLLEVQGFNKENPTVFYAHGFIETAQQESVQVMVSAYLEARPGTNVVLIDWSNMSHGSYLVNAARNTKKVGAAAAEQLHKLVEAGLPLEKLHIIGHSLGSHVGGYTARDLKNKYNKTVKRLTALDPAFPAFYPDNVMMEHINARDAEFVDVIHTDAGGCGAPVRTGTVDFWPNGGKSTQPGCPRFAPIPLSDDNLCSHWRSWRFYAESVRNPTAFPASPAESYHKFRENKTPEVGLVYMGFNCDTSAKGSFYLTTNAQEPFGRGMEGITDPKYKKK